MATTTQSLQPSSGRLNWAAQKTAAAVQRTKEFFTTNPTALKVAAAVDPVYRRAQGFVKEHPAATLGLVAGSAATGGLYLLGAGLGAVVGGTLVAGAAYKTPEGVKQRYLPAALQTPQLPFSEDWDPFLENISALADQGGKGAEVLGIKPGIAGELHRKKIDQIKPPSHPPSEEISEALDPHSRAVGTNWGAEIESNLPPLSNQVTIACTFRVMLNWAGITNLSESRILQIANQIQTNQDKRSIWQIFNHECKGLTLLQKLKAGLAYLIFFQTGLMHRIIFTLTRHHFNQLTKATDAPDDAARIEVFHKFLMHGNQFLAGERQAAQACIQGVRHPQLKDQDLNSHRKWMVENRYGFDLSKFCREASANLVAKNSPTVPFFNSLHNIPIVGTLSKAVESALNRLIQSKIKEDILPKALKASIENTEELTEPHQLKFAIKATELMTLMLEEFRKEIPKLGTGSNTLAVDPIDQQQVRTFAKHFINALNLKGNETVPDLRKILEGTPPDEARAQEGWAEWGKRRLDGGTPQITREMVDKELEKTLEISIFEGVNKLFSFFNDVSKSKELSARFLRIADSLFTKDERSAQKLRDDYTNAQSRLNDVSADLTDKLIKRSFKLLTEPEVDKDPNLPVKPLFEQTKQITKETLEALNDICKELAPKVAQKVDIHGELATLFKILKEFSISRKMRGEMQRIKTEHKRRLWESLSPFHKKMEEITQAALRLQGAQGQFTSHTEVTGALDRIHTLLSALEEDERLSASSLIVQELAVHKQTIGRALERPRVVPKVTAQVEEYLAQVEESVALIGQEQERINACVRLINRTTPSESLITQWQLYQSKGQIRTLMQPFKNEHFRKEIRSAIRTFPKEQKEALEKLIQNGSNIASKWGQIEQIIGQVQRAAQTTQAALKADLKTTIEKGSAWCATTSHQYKIKAEENYLAMRELSSFIEKEVAQMTANIGNADLPIYQGKPVAKRAEEMLRIGLLSYPPIRDTAKEHVLLRIKELSTKARLFVDQVVVLGAATRFVSEIGS